LELLPFGGKRRETGRDDRGDRRGTHADGKRRPLRDRRPPRVASTALPRNDDTVKRLGTTCASAPRSEGSGSSGDRRPTALRQPTASNRSPRVRRARSPRRYRPAARASHRPERAHRGRVAAARDPPIVPGWPPPRRGDRDLDPGTGVRPGGGRGGHADGVRLAGSRLGSRPGAHFRRRRRAHGHEQRQRLERARLGERVDDRASRPGGEWDVFGPLRRVDGRGAEPDRERHLRRPGNRPALRSAPPDPTRPRRAHGPSRPRPPRPLRPRPTGPERAVERHVLARPRPVRRPDAGGVPHRRVLKRPLGEPSVRAGDLDNGGHDGGVGELLGPGPGNGTWEVTDEAHTVLLGPVPVAAPASSASAPTASLSPLVLVAATLLAVGAALGMGSLLLGGRARPSPTITEGEEELSRLAEGRETIVDLVRQAGSLGLPEIEDAWEPPPAPPALADWLASLVTDGTLTVTLGEGGRARFALAERRSREPRVT